jgi:internalin A
MTTLAAEWNDYREWLKQIDPQLNLLNPEASKAQIQSLCKRFDFELPAELLELYSLNNGQSSTYAGSTFIGLTFSDIDNLIASYNTWAELYYEERKPGETYGDYFDYEQEGGTSDPVGAIKVKYINIKWIPIFDVGGGNYIGIDLDPDRHGTYGQVINFGRDEEQKFVIADSLTSFLRLINNQIKSGSLQMLKASEHGFGADANFYLMSLGNPLTSDLISSLRTICVRPTSP